jgi:hypothetical protein
LNNADNEDYQQNVIPFFRFVLKELEKEETKWFMRMKKSQLDTNEEEMRPLSDIFSVQRKYNSVVALKYFIMDSFAVSEIVKSNNGVSSYIEWFIDDWTPKLNNLWSKNKNGQKK